MVGAGSRLNFSEYDRVSLLCDLTSMADNCLTSANMFYLAFLSLYLFCRQPNPPAIAANIKTLKVKLGQISQSLSQSVLSCPSCTVCPAGLFPSRRAGGWLPS